VSHVGFNPDGSVDFSNIPPEWKAIFKQIGLRKNDLKDKAFAKQVYAIMSDALGTGTGSDSPSSVSGQLLAPIPPPIVDVPNAPLPPPLVPPPLDTTTTTTTTTSGIGTKSTPPPPPPPPPPPSQSSTSNKPLTPPVRSAASTGSSQPPPRNETKDVVAILKRAMEQHRMAMAGRHDEEDDEWSDWSDDDSDAQSASGSVASEDQKN
jgi:hypothetical protein